MVYKYTNTNFILSQFVHNKYNINIYIFTTITRILKALKRKESGYFGPGYFRDKFTRYAKEKYDMRNRQFQWGFGTHGFIFLCVIGNFTLGICTNAHLICSSVTVICETTSLIKQKNMFDHNGG